MRRILIAAACASALLLAGPADAQILGQFTGARTVPMGGHMFGAYLHSSENLAGLLAHLRLSFYPGIDFGFQGGLARVDFDDGNRTLLRLGADVKGEIARAGKSLPVDLALGAGLAVESSDDYHTLALGPTITASRALGPADRPVTPFVSAGLVITSFDVGATDDSDVSIPLRVGADWCIAPEVRIEAELQMRLSDVFNDDLGVLFGVNLPF